MHRSAVLDQQAAVNFGAHGNPWCEVCIRGRQPHEHVESVTLRYGVVSLR